jgi:antitoxin (DNA-binding transcriptional repressor) of toxin-antitoxin stability system
MAMHISVSNAKAQLTELVRRAEAGEDIVLTRHGQPAGRLAVLDAVRQAARTKVSIGPGGAPWDFLFGADGLPE